jgi:hypothetical protein
LGSLIYVALFFNLNWVHNYYQIPLMAVAAILLGGLLTEVRQLLDGLRPQMGASLVVGAVLLFAGQQVITAERSYYQRDPDFQQLGTVVSHFVPEGGLVVISHPASDARTPMFLYHSHRQGWQVNEKWLTVASLRGLMEHGATHYVSVRHFPLPEDLAQFLAPCPNRIRALRPNMGIQVFDLAPLRTSSTLAQQTP